MKRLLVCGGRNYPDRDHVHNDLDRIDDERGPFDVVITGQSGVVDFEAENWARGFEYHPKRLCGFRAEWDRLGKKAGPIRNQRMIDEGKPTLVVAFPGGKGTADMVKRATKAGVEVIEVERKDGEV